MPSSSTSRTSRAPPPPLTCSFPSPEPPPAGLTSLELADWNLDGEDALPELPKLRKVKLKNCSERNAKPGPWSAADEQKKRADNEAFLRAVRASAPLLTEENCKVDLTKTRG